MEKVKYTKQQQSGGLAFLYLLIPAIIGLGALILGIILRVGLSWDKYQLSRQMMTGTFLTIYMGVAAALLAVEISFMITSPLQREERRASMAGLVIRVVFLGLLVATAVFLLLIGKNVFLMACIALLAGTVCGLAGGIASLLRVKKGYFQPFPSSSGYIVASVIAIAVFLLLISPSSDFPSSDICGLHKETLTTDQLRREYEFEDMTMTDFARDNFNPGKYSNIWGHSGEMSDAMGFLLEKHGIDYYEEFPTAASKGYFELMEDDDRDVIMDAAWKLWLADTLAKEAYFRVIQPKYDDAYEEKKTEYITAVNEAYTSLLEDPELQDRVDIFNYILGKTCHYQNLIKNHGTNPCNITPITVEEIQTDWWNDPDSPIKFALNCGVAFGSSTEWYFGTDDINKLINARLMNAGLNTHSYQDWEKYDLAETPWDYENIVSLIVYDGESDAYVGINTVKEWVCQNPAWS